MLTPEEKKEKKKLIAELTYYLEYYKELSCRVPHVIAEYDRYIENIIERLKEIGR